MGEGKLIKNLKLSPQKGKELFTAYHAAAPYVKSTMNAAMQKVQDHGVVTTIMGRRARFNLWEPAKWGDKQPALPYAEAVAAYSRVKRAYGHKGLNYELQGSAADIMKMAMLRCWEDGIFDATGVPVLTVHDELDFIDPGGQNEAFKAMRHTMETCLPLRVPIRVDREVGPNWGDVREE